MLLYPASYAANRESIQWKLPIPLNTLNELNRVSSVVSSKKHGFQHRKEK